MEKTFELKFYALYAFANFTCKAKTLEEASKKLKAHFDDNGYCIEHREIKSIKFDGKNVSENKVFRNF